MLKHCKKYAKCPLVLKPFNKKDYQGKNTYKDDIPLLCSIAGKVQVVKNTHGEDTITTKTLYIDAGLLEGKVEEILDNDLLFFENKDHIPVGISIQYKKGIKDLYVVYC